MGCFVDGFSRVGCDYMHSWAEHHCSDLQRQLYRCLRAATLNGLRVLAAGLVGAMAIGSSTSVLLHGCIGSDMLDLFV